MADPVGTLEALAQQFGNALAPLETLLDSGNLLPFFSSLGLQFPQQLLANSAFMNSLSSGASAAGNLATLVTQLTNAIEQGDDAKIVSLGVSVVEQIPSLVTTLGSLGGELGNLSNSMPGMDAAQVKQFADNLAESILSYLIVSYLYSIRPGLTGVLNLLGVVDSIPHAGVAGDPTQPRFMSRKLNFSNLGGALSSPIDLFKKLFDWGSPSFDGSVLFTRLSATFGLLGIDSFPVTASGKPFLDSSLFAFQANTTKSPPQLCATTKYSFPSPLNTDLVLDPNWSATVLVQGAFDAGLQATFAPPLVVTLYPSAGELDGQFQIGISYSGADPLMIVGQTGGSRLQADSFSFGAGFAANWDAASSTATADPSIQLALTGGLLVIDMSEADGFLSDITSGTPIQATFAFAGTWAPDTGLHVTGGAQLEIDLPLHLDLGPVTIDTIYVVGGVGSSGLTLELSAAMGVTLGPIQASVDRIGLTGDLTFPNHGGNLGPANLKLGFKPPDGLGLEIDAGPASGGGYISFDPAKGQYAGVLDVSLLDIVQVKVIGVIDTIMPDGSSGFSFILIITFDLPPIELGFGFTLNGVGGLGGVNRTINSTALQAGFVAHSLNSILFPPDPIANAPEIISNITNFFPVAMDSYVFGPMMEIGWGTPTLITLEIGVILELPSPVVIVLLGLVEVALPDADAPLIQLHIDILGELDFGTKTLDLEGDMYDSSVLIYSMAGSLYFSVCWGSDPNFVYSVGGFNPHFNTAGLNLPPMQRCSVSIGFGDNPRISASNYFAVTSNSLQFGANVQAYASAAGFTIQGYLGFDVLIIFSPFSFEFDFSVSFSVSFEGINLLGLSVSGSFSGPTPWNLNGEASISILFWTVSASVNLTWGNSTPVTIPQRPVLPDLAKALQTAGNWSAALPPGMTPAVSLAAPVSGTPGVLVYPMGTLSVRENVVPLDVTVTRYGNATPSDGNIFAITDVQINGQPAQWQSLQEYFAPGQFNALSDADKLGAPSFELYDAGETIGSSAIKSGQDRPRTVSYQEFYIDSPMSYSRQTDKPYQMSADLVAALSRQGAGAMSPVLHSGFSKFSAGSALGAITTQDEGFVVANTNDLAVRTDIAPAGITWLQARAALSAHLAASPADAGTLQIVTVYEAAA